MIWLNTHCTLLECLHVTSIAIVWMINNQTQHPFPCRKINNEESLIEYWVKEGMGRKSGTHNQGTQNLSGSKSQGGNGETSSNKR